MKQQCDISGDAEADLRPACRPAGQTSAKDDGLRGGARAALHHMRYNMLSERIGFTKSVRIAMSITCRAAAHSKCNHFCTLFLGNGMLWGA